MQETKSGIEAFKNMLKCGYFWGAESDINTVIKQLNSKEVSFEDVYTSLHQYFDAEYVGQDAVKLALTGIMKMYPDGIKIVIKQPKETFPVSCPFCENIQCIEKDSVKWMHGDKKTIICNKCNKDYIVVGSEEVIYSSEKPRVKK